MFMQVNTIYHYVDNSVMYNISSIDKVKASWIWLSAIGLVIGFINGFFGGGGGMICVPTLTSIVALPEKKAHATAIVIMLPLCIVSFVVYIISGAFDGLTTLKVTIGFVLGGIIGAILLSKIRNVWLNIIFAVVILASGIKLML